MRLDHIIVSVYLLITQKYYFLLSCYHLLEVKDMIKSDVISNIIAAVFISSIVNNAWWP